MNKSSTVPEESLESDGGGVPTRTKAADAQRHPEKFPFSSFIILVPVAAVFMLAVCVWQYGFMCSRSIASAPVPHTPVIAQAPVAMPAPVSVSVKKTVPVPAPVIPAAATKGTTVANPCLQLAAADIANISTAMETLIIDRENDAVFLGSKAINYTDEELRQELNARLADISYNCIALDDADREVLFRCLQRRKAIIMLRERKALVEKQGFLDILRSDALLPAEQALIGKENEDRALLLSLYARQLHESKTVENCTPEQLREQLGAAINR